MKLYQLEWHAQFRMAPHGDHQDERVFTLERGDGMYMWVIWHDEEGQRHSGQMHIGEEVIPYEG